MARGSNQEAKAQAVKTCQGCDREFPFRLVHAFVIGRNRATARVRKLCPICATASRNYEDGLPLDALPPNPRDRAVYDEARAIYPEVT